VPSLAVRWTFSVPAADTVAGADAGFRASPVEDDGRLFIGSGNGRLYALNAATGHRAVEVSGAARRAAAQSVRLQPVEPGIASSAAITKIGGTDAVNLRCATASVGTGLGEGRLFALNAATGAVI
jgi:outer membrane protein assembly factor BamB